MPIANFNQFHNVVAMLTGLFQVALIVALLFIIVGVFAALVGIPIFGGVIAKLKKTGGRVSVSKVFTITLLFILFIGLSMIPTNKAVALSGTAGTVGSISASSNTVLIGTVVSIGLEGLDASADYDVRFSPGCSTNFTFTTSSTENYRTFHIKISKPTTGLVCYVELGNTTASNAGVLDETSLMVTSGDTFIGADFLMDILAPLAILGVASVLLSAFIGKKISEL